MAQKTISQPKTEANQAMPIDQAMRNYVDLVDGNKSAASRIFKKTLDNASKLRTISSILDHLVTALKNAGEEGRLNNDTQIERDLKHWAAKIIKPLEDADYRTKMKLMDTIMSAGLFPPQKLIDSLQTIILSQLDKMDKNQLLHSLIFMAYLGNDSSAFLGRWEGRYNELLKTNSNEFTFGDIADITYCCGEMRLELEDYFITQLCDRLRAFSETDENISQENAVRALHGLAMLDCVRPEQHKYHDTFLDVAKISLRFITSPEELSEENQRIVLTSCAWLDINVECPVPKTRAQSPNNQALRDKFNAYAEEIPQNNDAIATKLGFAAAVTTDIERPIHIVADEKIEKIDKFTLKGHALLESMVIAKITDNPVLHFNGDELSRLIKAKDDKKFADALGEYTWPALDMNIDDDGNGNGDYYITGGVYLISKRKGEIHYQPA